MQMGFAHLVGRFTIYPTDLTTRGHKNNYYTEFQLDWIMEWGWFLHRAFDSRQLHAPERRLDNTGDQARVLDFVDKNTFNVASTTLQIRDARCNPELSCLQNTQFFPENLFEEEESEAYLEYLGVSKGSAVPRTLVRRVRLHSTVVLERESGLFESDSSNSSQSES